VSAAPPLGLFEGVGLETELMIVDAQTLDVLPAADRLIAAACGRVESEIERGPLAWSNELALHVVELKTNGPAKGWDGLATAFARGVAEADALLAPLGARLMPTGMHPWMDPARELRVWPHAYGEVYAAFDRIFGCASHGWANLQSVHLNLPFAGEAEFGRLHAAARAVLPLLPALAASTPVAAGRVTDFLDTRLHHYGRHVARVPSLLGRIVPEPVWTRADYESQVLAPCFADLAPLDPEGILRHEWANARGAIARFDRSAVEIRLLDTQECPAADVAVAMAVEAVVKALVRGELSDPEAQRVLGTERLATVLSATTRDAERAVVADADLLRALGARDGGPRPAGELWAELVARTFPAAPGAASARAHLEVVLREGPLARRILSHLGPEPAPPREALARVYRALCDALAAGRTFRARA